MAKASREVRRCMPLGRYEEYINEGIRKRTRKVTWKECCMGCMRFPPICRWLEEREESLEIFCFVGQFSQLELWGALVLLGIASLLVILLIILLYFISIHYYYIVIAHQSLIQLQFHISITTISLFLIAYYNLNPSASVKCWHSKP
jgi:hypothetical protein